METLTSMALMAADSQPTPPPAQPPTESVNPYATARAQAEGLLAMTRLVLIGTHPFAPNRGAAVAAEDKARRQFAEVDEWYRAWEVRQAHRG